MINCVIIIIFVIISLVMDKHSWAHTVWYDIQSKKRLEILLRCVCFFNWYKMSTFLISSVFNTTGCSCSLIVSTKFESRCKFWVRQRCYGTSESSAFRWGSPSGTKLKRPYQSTRKDTVFVVKCVWTWCHKWRHMRLIEIRVQLALKDFSQIRNI